MCVVPGEGDVGLKAEGWPQVWILRQRGWERGVERGVQMPVLCVGSAGLLPGKDQPCRWEGAMSEGPYLLLPARLGGGTWFYFTRALRSELPTTWWRGVGFPSCTWA